jgi:hypothetical protein
MMTSPERRDREEKARKTLSKQQTLKDVTTLENRRSSDPARRQTLKDAMTLDITITSSAGQGDRKLLRR